MSKQIVIGFLFSTLLLVAFEYVFLTEIYAGKRPLILVAGVGGILLAALFFIIFFIKFRRASDDN
jgi:hypothetical protein